MQNNSWSVTAAVKYAVWILVAALTGCATYHPQPLDTHVDLPSAARLEVAPATLPLPALRSHRFDPSDGLDSEEVAMLAVANSPQLKVSRAQLGETRAQAFAAGLLPDPQISASVDYPINGDASTRDAHSLGLGFDISALLLRSSSRQAAGNELRRANLELLWQEWQVANDVRLLFARITEMEHARLLLAGQQPLYTSLLQHAQAAYAAGNRSGDQLSGDFSAVQALEQRLSDLDRQISSNRHQLNALLGLDQTVHLQLVGATAVPAIDSGGVEAALSDLARRRPDLLALQRGYDAQEARVRQAILAQFPPLSLGFSQASDTAGLLTNGFALSFTLPLWNRNQGQIAQERATRQRLQAEYRQRLIKADSAVRQLLDDNALLEQRLAASTQAAAQLQQTAHNAHNAQLAYAAGNLDQSGYLQLAAAATDKQIELLNLQETLTEQRIALALLLGSDVPLKP